MLSITEEEIQDLISKHNNTLKKNNKIPVYDLKTIIQYGLSFLYAKNHFENNVLQECHEEFSIYKKHKCSKGNYFQKSYKSNFIEVACINVLDKTEDVFKYCWTGYNLAILTTTFNLHGYFKNDLLFQKKFPESCALVATPNSICMGLFDGGIINYDPMNLTDIKKQCHSDIITHLSYDNDVILSASLDGSVYYDTKIMINESGILECKYISEDKFICSCNDNSLVLYDSGNLKTFLGHKRKINSLSYNKFGLSSSRDGMVGFLHQEQFFETHFLGVSDHKRLDYQQFLGYGLDKIMLYNAITNTEIWSLPQKTSNIDIKDNIFAYNIENQIILKDLRSKDTLSIPLNVNVTDLSFSPAGDMLLVCTEHSPYIFNLKSL